VGRIQSMARAIHLLLLGIWAGAGLYHLVVIIPEALGAFSSRQDALAFIGRGLADLDTYGLFAGPVLLLSLLAGWVRTGARLWPRAALVLLLFAEALLSGRVLAPQITALEAALPTLAAADPARLELERLYVAADGFTIAAVIIAALLLMTSAGSTVPRRQSGIQL